MVPPRLSQRQDRRKAALPRVLAWQQPAWLRVASCGVPPAEPDLTARWTSPGDCPTSRLLDLAWEARRAPELELATRIGLAGGRGHHQDGARGAQGPLRARACRPTAATEPPAAELARARAAK